MGKGHVIMILVIALSLIIGCSTEKEGDFIPPSFSTNYGYVAEHNGNYFFANSDDENKLYQMDGNCKNLVKLSDFPNAGRGLKIQFVENKLLYLQISNSLEGSPPYVYTLYEYSLEKKSEMKLLNMNICDFLLYNERIVFSTIDEGGIYSANMDGTDVRKITGPFAPRGLHVYAGRLYYSHGEAFIREDFDGTNIVVLGPTFSLPPVLYGKHLYYIDFSRRGLHRLNVSSFDRSAYNYKTKTLVEENVESFTIKGGTLYYATRDNKIYRISLNGWGRTFITNGSGPIATGSRLFYYNEEGEMKHIP